jgi:hypothetical protein
VTSKQLKIDRYREQNLEAAEIILADAIRYGGEGSLMVRWARSVVADSNRRAVEEPGT